MRQSWCVRILTTVTEHLQTWPRHNACPYPCHWLERPNNNLRVTAWDFIMENLRHTNIWRAMYHTLCAGFWRKIGFRHCFCFFFFWFFERFKGQSTPKFKKKNHFLPLTCSANLKNNIFPLSQLWTCYWKWSTDLVVAISWQKYIRLWRYPRHTVDERLAYWASWHYSSAEEDAINVYIPQCHKHEFFPWVHTRFWENSSKWNPVTSSWWFKCIFYLSIYFFALHFTLKVSRCIKSTTGERSNMLFYSFLAELPL